MKSPDIAKQGLLRINEVAKATGVSITTLHYYTRAGLLLPSLKTAHNMAYYSRDCVNEIQLIKELQAKRFLPLSVIKLLLRARREGQGVDHLLEMESVLSDMFQPVADDAGPGGVSLSELEAASGLSESVIRDLEARHFLQPVETEQGRVFDDIDIRIAQTFKKLTGFGLKHDDLDVLQQHIELVRKEVRVMHDIIHRLPNHEAVPLREFFKTLKDFRDCLETRVIRQEAEHIHEQDLQDQA